MKLQAIQAAVTDLCLSLDPDPAAIETLHEAAPHWLVYRHMVRSRLEQMVHRALRRTVRTAGKERFAATFAAYLAERPPRTRYIREVVTCFAEYAQPIWRDAELPPHTVDLLRFEAARWDLADRPRSQPMQVADFDFEALPVLGTVHEVLGLEYPVHRKLPAGTAYVPERCWLLLYRRPGRGRVEVMSLNELSAALLDRWRHGRETGGETVAASVRELAASRGFAVDTAFVERLCEVLAELLTRGVILGSRREA